MVHSHKYAVLPTVPVLEMPASSRSSPVLAWGAPVSAPVGILAPMWDDRTPAAMQVRARCTRMALRVLTLLFLFYTGCGHQASHRSGSGSALGAEPCEEYVLVEGEEDNILCNSASARIWALIGKGQFTEAQVLIAESQAAGLLTAQQAAQMLDRITLLNTRLGQIPASLQRVANFPSQLKDYTLFQIQSMLSCKDFSLATQPQLKLAIKLLKESERLMQKAQNAPR